MVFSRTMLDRAKFTEKICKVRAQKVVKLWVVSWVFVWALQAIIVHSVHTRQIREKIERADATISRVPGSCKYVVYLDFTDKEILGFPSVGTAVRNHPEITSPSPPPPDTVNIASRDVANEPEG